MAYSQRDAGSNVNVNGVWLPGEEREGPVGWVRGLHAALGQYAPGRAYVNFMGSEPEDRVRGAYGPEKYARLVTLKDHWDPQNVFCSNQNIRPSTQT